MPLTDLAYASKDRPRGRAYSPKLEKLRVPDTRDSWHTEPYSVQKDTWFIGSESAKLGEVPTIIVADPRDNLVHDWPRRMASAELHGMWVEFHDMSHEMSADSDVDLDDEWELHLDVAWSPFSPTLPSVDPVTEVNEVIEEASWILSQHTWDDDDDVRYEQATMDRARDFLLFVMYKARHYHGRSVPVPAVNPAGAGSIDIFWDLDGRQLLVNVSADSSEPIAFYGEDRFGTVVSGVRTPPRESEGVMELRQLDYLVTWLSSQ